MKFSSECIICGFDHKKNKKEAKKAHRIKRNFLLKVIKKATKFKKKNKKIKFRIEDFEE